MLRKIIVYATVFGVLFIAISFLTDAQKPKISPDAKFTMDTNYDINEDIDTPKVIFVYSDPTEHHPQG